MQDRVCGAGAGAVGTVCPAAPQTADTASATGIQPGDSIDVKLAKLRKLNEEADYTGMSYGEIYTAIWNRYDEAFDGNWTSIMAFSRIQEKGSVAASDFRSEISRNIRFHLEREFEAETGIDVLTWTKDEWSQHKRDMAAYSKYVQSKYGNLRAQALGYGNMTIDEIEQAIYEKYEGKDSVQDFLNLQGELLLTGVMDSKLGSDGASAYWNTIGDQLPQTYFFDNYMEGTAMNVSQDRWDAVLGSKFDVRAFASDMRATLRNTTFSGWDFDIEGTISKGIDYLLISLGQTE